MLSGRLATLREWIDRIPEDVLLAYPPMLVASAWISAFAGDVTATHRFALSARQASFDGSMVDGSTSYVSAVAMLQAGLGHKGMKDANAHAELALRLEPKESPWRPLTAGLAGVTRFGLGQYEDARRALGEAARSPAGSAGESTYARGQLALLEMHEGRWDEGSRHAEVACTLIEEANLGNLLSSGAAIVASAAAAAHVGDRGLALQRLRSLAPVQKVLSDAIPFDAFQIHLITAETYLLLGDHGAASIHARSATSRLEHFGDAGIFEERLAQVQVTLGSSSDGVDAHQTEPNVLTDRELQILAMLQSDLTLRDIGSELYVSRNTAKSHVASVYRKLGVTSRTAAVARARQLELI
jgi:LuxR family maltose regulon positive regulatory protein